MPTNDKLQHPVHNISNIYTNKICTKQSFLMKGITTTKEEYYNILNELLELPSMPDIGEPNVTLADGEQLKSDVE